MKYDGYRLTYGGLDYLALHAHTKSGAILHLGSNRTATGKESDIYLVTTPSITPSSTTSNLNVPPERDQAVFKIHRLGRTSFRTLKTNRAYHGNRQHATWQRLSQLSAQKEFGAMRALYAAGFPVPRPIAQNRHTVVMSLVPGLPLTKVPLSAYGKEGTEQAAERLADLYGKLMELALKLAEAGVIHGDFNEFNLLVENVPDPEEDEDEDEDEDNDNDDEAQLNKEDMQKNNPEPSPETIDMSLPLIPHLIDFPQITSMQHPQAQFYFDRDVECVKRFFRKKYHFTAETNGPTFEEAQARLEKAQKLRLEGKGPARLDIETEAAGFSKKMAKELQGYYEAAAQEGDEEVDENDPDGIRDDGNGDDLENGPQVEHTDLKHTNGTAHDLDDEPFDLMQSIRDAQGYDEVPTPAIHESLAPKLAALELSGSGGQQSKKTKKTVGWSI